MYKKNESKAMRHCLNALLVVAFVACFPLGFVLPQQISWENHSLEMMQNITLVLGLFMAVWHARQLAGRPASYLLWIACIFWLGFFGRELSWGAALMPSTEMTIWGPSYRGHDLWWKPYMRGALVLMALVGVYWFFAKQLWSRVLLRLLRERAVPVVALLVYVCTMLTTINAEGHGFIYFQGWYGTQVMVLEELVECVGYLALLCAQYWTIQQMKRW